VFSNKIYLSQNWFIASISLVTFRIICVDFPSDKTLPATSNALVVRILVIHQTATDVVLGFIGWTCGHPPENDSDAIAGFTGWAFSLHDAKLLRVTDKTIFRLFPPNPY
jgi:hypothetical protein